MNLKKLLFAIFFLVFFLPLKVDAFSISPSSGNYQPGINQSISIVASGVPSNSTAVQVSITLSGPCQVVSYTGPTSSTWQLTGSPSNAAVGNCSGGVSFTNTAICAGMVKAGSNIISNGESLGTMVINCSTQGNLSILASDSTLNPLNPAGYVVSTTLTPVTGTLGSFTVNSSTPNTAISITDFSLLLGIFLILFGIFLYLNAKKTLNDNGDNLKY